MMWAKVMALLIVSTISTGVSLVAIAKDKRAEHRADSVSLQQSLSYEVVLNTEVHHQLTLCDTVVKAGMLREASAVPATQPVCAALDSGTRCCCAPCYLATTWRTFSTSLEACADPKVEGYFDRPCESYR